MIRREFLSRLMRHTGEFLGISYVFAGGNFLKRMSQPDKNANSHEWTAEIPIGKRSDGPVLVPLKRSGFGFHQKEQIIYGIFIQNNRKNILFLAQCTHLSCTLRIKDKKIFCPCHNGVFNLEGWPISGPPKLPLKEAITLKTSIQNKILRIKARFS